MTATLSAGTVFAARYRIVRCMASGGMGAVYEAVHLETDRRHALKVMHAHLFESDEMRDRFKREARISSQIESEHIVAVSDAGVDDATKMPFMVMELLRGEDLSQRLKRMDRLPPAEVLAYLHQTALALDRTHANAIVHRDLKPANVFLTQREDGTPLVKILDFGIAKLVREGATAAGATQSLGTPTYMAPEQFRVGTKLTPAADIYALGMMAYTLLVGKAYWSQELQQGGDVIAFVMVAIGGPKEPATLRAAARGVMLPPRFDAWFARATAADPNQRFPTASEAVRALGEALGPTPAYLGTPVMSATVPWTPDPQPTLDRAATSNTATVSPARAPRNRAPAIVAVVALSLAAFGLGTWLGLRPKSRNPAMAPTPAMGAPTEATAAPAASPSSSASVSAPLASASAPADPGPTASAPAELPSSPPLSGKKPTAKPKPTAAPSSAVPPLIGRD